MSTVYSRLENILNGRSSRKVAVATTIRRIDGGGIAVRYHATDVVTVRDGVVTLNSGGWRTATTKKRVNAYLPDGWSLYQHRHEWFLRGPVETLPFTDGVTVPDTDAPAPLGWETVGTDTL